MYSVNVFCWESICSVCPRKKVVSSTSNTNAEALLKAKVALTKWASPCWPFQPLCQAMAVKHMTTPSLPHNDFLGEVLETNTAGCYVIRLFGDLDYTCQPMLLDPHSSSAHVLHLLNLVIYVVISRMLFCTARSRFSENRWLWANDIRLPYTCSSGLTDRPCVFV